MAAHIKKTQAGCVAVEITTWPNEELGGGREEGSFYLNFHFYICCETRF